MNIFELDKQFIANTYRRFDVELTSGKGATLYDSDGKKYIDLGSGIGVNVFGAGDEEWKKAVIEQLNQLPHASNLYYTRPQTRLAQMLCEKTGMCRVFFGNSGAEANECAIKVMRKYANDKYGKLARPTIITLVNSFHGRTLTTLSATGQDVFHQYFDPFTPGFVHVPAGDIEAMTKALDAGNVCGVLMEMIQGEGGVLPLDKAYVQAVEKECRKRDVLLAVDEVQTGNGRTGAMYSYELFGIHPDVVSTAKALGGGLPLGACLLGERVKDTLSAGTHGSTFGGNPVCCAGAISIVSRLNDDLFESVRKKSAYLVAGLTAIAGVKSVTGLGLMLGIETEKPAAEIVKACIAKGLLPLTAKTKVRLLPPLTITMDELTQALAIMKEVIES